MFPYATIRLYNIFVFHDGHHVKLGIIIASENLALTWAGDGAHSMLDRDAFSLQDLASRSPGIWEEASIFNSSMSVYT